MEHWVERAMPMQTQMPGSFAARPVEGVWRYCTTRDLLSDAQAGDTVCSSSTGTPGHGTRVQLRAGAAEMAVQTFTQFKDSNWPENTT
eukprot:1149271-Pelagomonas_calceolata.AAC.1